jgi:hypothetical protein
MNSFRGFLFYAALPVMSFWSTEVLGFMDFGKGRPVNFQDLAGKKFCWDGGRWVRYEANGQFLNNHGGHGSWVVLDRAVVEWRDQMKSGEYRGDRYGQWQMVSDGRLHSYSYCLLCGEHDHDHWATPCA